MHLFTNENNDAELGTAYYSYSYILPYVSMAEIGVVSWYAALDFARNQWQRESNWFAQIHSDTVTSVAQLYVLFIQSRTLCHSIFLLYSVNTDKLAHIAFGLL